MRRSTLFCETLRQNPTDTEIAGHQLLIRGGYVQALAAGLYSYLPLGLRVKRKIEGILRQAMDTIGGQEILMPLVQPVELWQESGRWQTMGPELARFKDRAEREMVLAMTHEEVITDLLRKRIRSYRQLPLLLYQIQTKFRDEPRARGGLIRVREFTMKDAYSCHLSVESLDAYYPLVVDAYHAAFRRLGLPVIAVQSDVGMMGGTTAHEFIYLSEVGEDQLALCAACGYAANRQIARFLKEGPAPEEPRSLEEVATPGTQSIAALAALLEIPASRTAKAAFFMAGERLIFAVVRGDMEVNETKLANAVGATELRPAQPEELLAAGIVAGYASPIGVRSATVIVDDLVARSPNLVAGANRPGYHLLHTNVPRDYQPDEIIDIAAAYPGAPCEVCGHPLRLARGVEVGNTFKLGTRYSRALGATYLSEAGQLAEIVMACYGIGVDRLLACLAEVHHDQQGLIWPLAVAPFQVYLVGLDLEHEPIRVVAESMYATLLQEGIEVLYDDRNERAGVKFKDADLMGIPLRITISRRSLQAEALELRTRAGGEIRQVPLAAALQTIKAELAPLSAGPAS